MAAALPGIVDGNDQADRRVEHHVATCLRCQAELVHYRRLLRALRQLRTEYLEPAPGVLSGILANLEEAASGAPSAPCSRASGPPTSAAWRSPPPPRCGRHVVLVSRASTGAKACGWLVDGPLP